MIKSVNRASRQIDFIIIRIKYEVLPERQGSRNDVASVRRLSKLYALKHSILRNNYHNELKFQDLNHYPKR